MIQKIIALTSLLTLLSGCSIFDSTQDPEFLDSGTTQKDMFISDMALDLDMSDMQNNACINCQGQCVNVQGQQDTAFCIVDGGIVDVAGNSLESFVNSCLTNINTESHIDVSQSLIALPISGGNVITVAYENNKPVFKQLDASGTNNGLNLPTSMPDFRVKHLARHGDTIVTFGITDSTNGHHIVSAQSQDNTTRDIPFETSTTFCDNDVALISNRDATTLYALGQVKVGTEQCEMKLLRWEKINYQPPQMDMGTDMDMGADMGADLGMTQDMGAPPLSMWGMMTDIGTNISTSAKKHGPLLFDPESQTETLTGVVRIESKPGTYLAFEYANDTLKTFAFAPSTMAEQSIVSTGCPQDPKFDNFTGEHPLYPGTPLFGYANLGSGNARNWLVTNDQYKGDGNQNTYLRVITHSQGRLRHTGCEIKPSPAYVWPKDVKVFGKQLWIVTNVANKKQPLPDAFNQMQIIQNDVLNGEFQPPIFSIGNDKNRFTAHRLFLNNNQFDVVGTYTPDNAIPQIFLMRLTEKGDLLCRPIN